MGRRALGATRELRKLNRADWGRGKLRDEVTHLHERDSSERERRLLPRKKKLQNYPMQSKGGSETWKESRTGNTNGGVRGVGSAPREENIK